MANKKRVKSKVEKANVTITPKGRGFPIENPKNAFIFIEYRQNESIAHTTNIPNIKRGNKYFCDLLRILADRVEEADQAGNYYGKN